MLPQGLCYWADSEGACRFVYYVTTRLQKRARAKWVYRREWPVLLPWSVVHGQTEMRKVYLHVHMHVHWLPWPMFTQVFLWMSPFPSLLFSCLFGCLCLVFSFCCFCFFLCTKQNTHTNTKEARNKSKEQTQRERERERERDRERQREIGRERERERERHTHRENSCFFVSCFFVSVFADRRRRPCVDF